MAPRPQLPQLPPAEELDGKESVPVVQGGRTRLLAMMGLWKWISGRLGDTVAAAAAKAATDAVGPVSDRVAAVERRAGTIEGRATALEASDAAQGTRLAALEGRPEEVAHFTGTIKLPNLALGATTALTVASLAPARAGDKVKAGETVSVRFPGTAPSGANLGAAWCSADGVVQVQLRADLVLSAGNPIPVEVLVLR